VNHLAGKKDVSITNKQKIFYLLQLSIFLELFYVSQRSNQQGILAEEEEASVHLISSLRCFFCKKEYLIVLRATDLK
jgi:hypothetical protein